MKDYKVISTIKLEYEIEAENEEEALWIVLSGKIKPTNSIVLNDEVFEK